MHVPFRIHYRNNLIDKKTKVPQKRCLVHHLHPHQVIIVINLVVIDDGTQVCRNIIAGYFACIPNHLSII
jgi:hypothetical protein